VTHLKAGGLFPDFELPNHDGKLGRLSHYARAGELDKHLGFDSGYPLVVIFYRGFFCPRDRQQFRLLVPFQDELRVNFCRMASVAVQPAIVQAAFRAGLGANWPFLCDTEREAVNSLGILDETEGEYAFTSRPFTFVLFPDMTIYKIYDGWYFVGRPTVEELRQDLRGVMSKLPYYRYDAWNTDEAKQIRIPAAEWIGDVHEPGAGVLPVAEGIVESFDLRAGNGVIRTTGGDAVFFNFTAIPGEGYRTISAGAPVRFEVVQNKSGPSARNIQLI